MKMKNFQLHTTTKKPEGCERFAQVFQIVHDALASGQVGLFAIVLFAALHLKCNFHNGKGVTTIREICEMLRLTASKKNINKITKELGRMRKQKLLWYPSRTGSKTFAYVLYGYKLKESESGESTYVDVEKYFALEKPTGSRTFSEAHAELTTRSPPEKQSFENQKNGSTKSVGDLLQNHKSRTY
jgi:hypothetical protein